MPHHATLDVLRRVLEAAGIIFLADGETTAGGPGVRKQRSAPSKTLEGEAGIIDSNEM